MATAPPFLRLRYRRGFFRSPWPDTSGTQLLVVSLPGGASIDVCESQVVACHVFGELPERSNGPVSKTGDPFMGSEGSNPPSPLDSKGLGHKHTWAPEKLASPVLREVLRLKLWEHGAGHLAINRIRSEPTGASTANDSPRRGNWQAIRLLGEGGQGRVFLAFDTTPPVGDRLLGPRDWVDELGKKIQKLEPRLSLDNLAIAFAGLLAPDGLKFGALKIVHDEGHGKDGAEKARLRFLEEMEAYRRVQHPGLLRLIDAHLDERWYVSEFFRKGTLDAYQDQWRGRPIEALRTYRQVVDAVSNLHKNGLVHRDIKPQNIFLTDHDNLVIGDLGIVFIDEDGRTRVSDAFEKVGSNDWMAPWANPFLVGDPKPNLDVFSLGKVLWAIVTGSPKLPNIYSKGPSIPEVCGEIADAAHVEQIVKKCVVPTEEECGFEDAGELLAAIDEALDAERRPLHVRAAIQAFSRPGPLFLVSISASAKRKSPDCQPKELYWKLDRDARQLHNVHEQYLFESTEHGRWLVRPPSDKRARDNTVEIWFPRIPLTDCKYFQLAMEADWQTTFVVYLHFDPGGWWIRFDAALKKPEKSQSPGLEFGVPAGQAAQVAPFKPVYFDISAAWHETWEQEAVSSAWLSGIRFRGDFQLLFARII